MIALSTAPAAIALLATLLAPLAPGRYAGQVPGARVDLTLFEDGRAIFGGAALRWSTTDDTLVLEAPGGRKTVLTVHHGPGGTRLEGSPYGSIALTPLPDIEPVKPAAPIRPLAWVGAWRHRASGGALVLRLIGDGRYEMQQPVTPGETAIPAVGGGWTGDDGRLSLTPDGGAPLTYTARRDGDDLLIGGGDLPVEIRFSPDAPR